MYDKSVEFIPVIMETLHASAYPRYEVPKGYTLAGYREGFERGWAQIEQRACDADCSPEGIREATETFLRVFGTDLEKAKRCCLFILDGEGNPVATGSLWMGSLNGRTAPRLHYIATDPRHGGRGLCKAILTAVFDLQREQGLGEYMYLTTQTPSYQAIHIYEQFGFRPYMGACPPEREQDPDFEVKNKRAWELIRAKQNEYVLSRR